ncbi:MAG: DUF4783 domain-containing protein [Bacteroidales bacterium]
MKSTKIILRIAILALILGFTADIHAQQESEKELEEMFASQNMTKISNKLNSTVKLKTPEREGNFSRKQTSLILEKFFDHYPVKDFNINRSGSFSDGSVFYLCTLESNTKKEFRVYFVCRKVSGKSLIQILTIEQQ